MLFIRIIPVWFKSHTEYLNKPKRDKKVYNTFTLSTFSLDWSSIQAPYKLRSILHNICMKKFTLNRSSDYSEYISIQE